MKEKLLAYMDAHDMDGFYITRKENVRFISGYTGDDSTLLITKSACYFLTDPRYTEQAAAECPDFTIVNWRELALKQGTGYAAAYLAKKHGLKAVGFEASSMTYADYMGFNGNMENTPIPTTGVIEELRIFKTPREIECLRAACQISCRAFERIIKDIRVGVTEKELAAKLALYMVQEGADTQPYGNILISGARTSLLHGIPSAKAVEYGDLVLMDFGCQYKGYLSDMTRTVVVGTPTQKQREVYALEKRMLEDSLDAMKPGAKMSEVYAASIKAIEGTEYFPYHYTGIGHGIGLFVHEPPFMGPGREELLIAGSVRTIEPGLYIPGWGGVRIEDQVLITENGYENMISVTHDLIEL